MGITKSTIPATDLLINTGIALTAVHRYEEALQCFEALTGQGTWSLEKSDRLRASLKKEITRLRQRSLK